MYFTNDDSTIKGVGIDMSTVSRFEAMEEPIRESLSKKILSEKERINYNASPNKSLYLAKCFSVKEAVSKALGTGMKGISSAEIELHNDEKGGPFVVLNGRASVVAEGEFITSIKISITHENGTVAVIAIAQ